MALKEKCAMQAPHSIAGIVVASEPVLESEATSLTERAFDFRRCHNIES
jgi:hypothetical protein